MTSSGQASSLADIEDEYFKCYSQINSVTFSEVFSTDFGRYRCQLDAAITHLGRWGKAVGFVDVLSRQLSSEECSKVNIANAKVQLSTINKKLLRAYEDGSEFQERQTNEDKTKLDSEAQIGKSIEPYRALHVALTKIIKMRAPGNRSIPSTKIILLFDTEEFDTLVRSVHSLVQRLNILFPSLKDEQTLLSSEEIRIVEDGIRGNILWLKEIVKSDDEFLKKAIEQETSNNRDFFNNITMKDDVKGHIGHKFNLGSGAVGRPVTFDGIRASGRANVHMGNVYGPSK